MMETLICPACQAVRHLHRSDLQKRITAECYRCRNRRVAKVRYKNFLWFWLNRWDGGLTGPYETRDLAFLEKPAAPGWLLIRYHPGSREWSQYNQRPLPEPFTIEVSL